MNMIINKIRSFNRRRLTRRHLKRVSVNTPFGFKFFGPSAMQNGNFEITETKILIKLIFSSRCICKCWCKFWILYLYSSEYGP